MAATDRSWCGHFLILCALLTFNNVPVRGIQEFLGSCQFSIDLLENNLQSAIVRMPLPENMQDYQDPKIDRNCDITIRFSHGTNLMIELYYLDIIPDKDASGACTTGLEVYDQSMKNVYGNRLCMEAWEWEERHALSKQEKKIVYSSPLIFRLVSEGPYRGNGFKVHFNQFRPQYPCSNREFKCVELARCVHDDLTCDGWDDCGDHSDEEREAGCDLLTASEICAVVMGCLFFLGQVIITVLFCVTYRRLRRDYGLVRDHSDRSESKMPLGMDPALYKRYNSQESMGTHYSRTTAGGRTRRDSDSSIEKLDLDKLDRLTMDNGSERSYRSNPKSKARSLALGSDTASEIHRKTGQYSYNGGRRGRVASSTSVNKGEAPLKINGIDNSVAGDSPRESVEKNGGRMTPDRRSTGSRRRNRSRNNLSDYSDEDDDRRRRRRSRDRRSQRYSDDDSESDYDRDRRRRRRRRSYSDDDYDSYDSEYERERRRRRRSKERQRRSRELDGENPDKEDKEIGEGKEEPRRRRESRDRKRDSYDSEEEDRRRRRRRRSPSYDDYDDDSRDQRRRRRSRSYEDDDYEDRDRRRRRRSRSYDDNDVDDDRQRRRSNERRRGQSAERSRRPPSSEREEIDTSKDAERMSKAIAKEVESKVPKYEAGRVSPKPPPPSSFKPMTPKEGTPPPPFKAKEETPPPPRSQKKATTPPPARDPSPPPAVSVKQPSNHSYHPPAPQQKQRLPPVAPPPSGDEVRRMEEERERRKQQLHQQRIQRHQQAPSPSNSTPAAANPPETDNHERRRSQDNRRERYSRDRFRQRGRRSDPEPPSPQADYEDVNPRVKLDAPLTGYREETV